MFEDLGSALHLFRILFHVVLGVFFFAIWLGPGQRRRTWLLWTIAFAIDTVQISIHLYNVVFGGNMALRLAVIGLSLVWLWVVITASYMWTNNGSVRKIPKWPYVFGTVWMLIFVVVMLTGRTFSPVFMSSYLAGVMIFLAFIYYRVGGIVLGLVGMWSGGGDAVTKTALSAAGVTVTLRMDIVLDMSVELASLALFLTILYLYLEQIRKERDAYEGTLRSQNHVQGQALDIVAGIETMENNAAQEELDDSARRYNGGHTVTV